MDFLASEEHFVDHLAPIWHALPPNERGTFWVTGKPSWGRASMRGIEAQPLHRHDHTQPVVVASYGDVKRARTYGNGGIALLQHGAGQSYGNTHPSYSGGDDHSDVGLFLCPNVPSAERWADRYPGATAAVVGSPRVESLPKREGPREAATIAFSWHWNCNAFPETRPAFMHFRTALGDLQRFNYRIIGHGHPRARKWLEPWYRRYGIPRVWDFDDVCRQADVYICDNSSTIFEFAATGRPVLLMNDPGYRRNVEFGLRFWAMSTVGYQVNNPRELVEAVPLALTDPRGLREERERIVRLVYGEVTGSTGRAVEALRRWQA